MAYETMSDEQIIEQITSVIEKKRTSKRIKLSTLARRGGFNMQTYSNFTNRKTDIRISTLIQIFRGLNELDALENLFSAKEAFSPTGIKQNSVVRVRDRKSSGSRRNNIVSRLAEIKKQKELKRQESHQRINEVLHKFLSEDDKQ